MAEKLAMAAVATLVAPVCEELVFRGFLWSAIRRFAPAWLTLLATSLLFAIFHLEPVQGLPALLLGLTAGWLRWHGRSIWPAVVVHGANNAIVSVLLVTSPEIDPSPWWLWVPAVVVTVGLVAVVPAAGRR